MADLDFQVPNLPNQSQSLIVEIDNEGNEFFLYVPKSREFDREIGGESYPPYQDDHDDHDDHDPFSILNFPHTSNVKKINFPETDMYLIFGSLLPNNDTITIFFGFFNCSSESQNKYEVVSRCFFTFSTYCHDLFQDQECIIDLGDFSWAIASKSHIHFVQVTQKLLDALEDYDSSGYGYVDIICCGVSFTTKTLEFSSISPLGSRIESPYSIVNCGGELLIEHEEEDYHSRGSDIFRKLCITIPLLYRERIFPDWFSYSFIIDRHCPGKDNGDTDDEEPSDVISTKISDDIQFSQGPGSGEQ
jgi:hypothetical protein